MPLADQPVPDSLAMPPGERPSIWLRALRSGGRKAAARDSGHAARSATLKQIIADLDLLNHQTEQDFLRIGGKLTEFVGAVKLISSDLAALTGLIEGEHGLRAADALKGALNRSTEMRTGAELGSSLLAGMHEEARRLKQTLFGFEGTISTFGTLGVLTRIETARLGIAGADFGNLADDVKSLAGNVRARVESAMETAALLLPPIESAIRDISALEQGQVNDLPSVTSGVMASLASFRELQERAHASSLRLRSQSDAISDAFGKLIVSIQFHDITRQQVEHVIEALNRLCSESERRDIATVLAVQSSQLADAGEKFAASVASVAHNLHEIAEHVHEMAGESRLLSGLSEDEKNSFFLEMERGCSAILGSLTHCAYAEGVTHAASGGMAEVIGRMHGSIEEIRAIEIQVQRMSLNASVRAAHIGASGDALGVLAGAMQRLASDCAERAEVLSEALGAMSGAATRLSGHGGPALAAGEDDCLGEMRTAVADLHSSSERSFAQIAQVVARGIRLREELCTTRDSLSVGTLFAEAVSRARDTLRSLQEREQPGLSSDDAAARSPGDFSRHYTMQAERDVHEEVTGARAGEPVAALSGQPDSPFGEAGGMEDNVELF